MVQKELDDLVKIGKDLEDFYGLPVEEEINITRTVREFLFARKYIKAFLEKIKNDKFLLIFSDKELNSILSSIRNKRSEIQGIDLPTWQTTLLKAIEDLKKGREGTINIILNPLENNQLKPIARSLTIPYKMDGRRQINCVEINTQLLRREQVVREKDFLYDFLTALYSVQESCYYNEKIRPQFDLPSHIFLKRNEVRGRHISKSGYRSIPAEISGFVGNKILITP